MREAVAAVVAVARGALEAFAGARSVRGRVCRAADEKRREIAGGSHGAEHRAQETPAVGAFVRGDGVRGAVARGVDAVGDADDAPGLVHVDCEGDHLPAGVEGERLPPVAKAPEDVVGTILGLPLDA